ncbi:TonB-dependent receptor [Caulobacter sp. 17J65-9]|uniref:TonB-dependent receptor n=1 Tax=Caulobacter sp. 17J65-9 TaxID=2709382 RepID=UPI0013C67411|nr:TonB-dependent receptor [Caulobacter sp. 17J65-9]NEX92749.1 TonB-dependent receptor [Caulobacter sp. 17J65-9]
MSKFTERRARALRYGVAVSVIAAAMGVAGAAAAQSAPADDTVEEVVVTGFRGSLRQAIDVKRQETGVVDAIMAEDIADFPDLNLAESIQRVPGVAIDRDAGEGRSITVRGLSADFTRTRINGMEAQATTGGTDSSGGANRGRGFDFNVFASDLFNSIKISKTAAAETEEGSLGATVDLQTSRPFDYKDFTMAGSAQYGYNDLSQEYDPRLAFLISDRFADGKFGALLSVAYGKRNLIEEGYSSVRWDNGPSSGGFCSPVGHVPQNPTNSGSTGSSATNCATGIPRMANTPGNQAVYDLATGTTASPVFHPRLPRYGRLTHSQDRLGVTGALQWRPADSTLISYELLYSKLDATRQEDFLEALSFSRNASAGGKTQINVLDAAVDNGELVYGLFDNVDVRSESRYDELSTEFTQHTLSLEHDFSDSLHAKAYVGQAVSDFTNPIQTTVTFDRTNTDGYSWDYRQNSNLPLIDYGFDVTDPAAWSWIGAGAPATALPTSEIRLRPNGVKTTFRTAQFDLAWDVEDNVTLKTGVNYKTFKSDSYDFRRTLETSVPALPAGTTLADISNVLTGFGRNLGAPSGIDTAWLRPDLNAIADLYNIYCNCDTGVPGGDFRLTSITNGNARGGNRSVEEKDLAAYVQVDFKTDLPIWDMGLRGNLGIRQAKTEIYAEGYSSQGGGTLVWGKHDYTDTLPSLNLALDLNDDMVLRFGAAKVMARPQIGNTLAGTNYLVPTTSLATTGTTYTASKGNVELEPFRAKTFDLSFEWYFAPESLFSVAVFYKDIDSYIQLQRQDLLYSQLSTIDPVAFDPAFCPGPIPGDPAKCAANSTFQYTTAFNTEGGPLKGYEISFQQPFTFLPGPFDGLGVQLNYTHVESEIDYCANALCTTVITNDMASLSPESYNATLYYETDKLSARVSAASREGYLQNVPGRNNNALEGKQGTFNVDVSASYKFNDNFTVTFEGLNLTDEFNAQWVGDDTRESTSVYHHTGRQYYFGFRYKY